MNRIYRLVFNRHLGVVQVASEHATATAGSGRTASAPALHAHPLALALSLLLAGVAGLGATASVQAQEVVNGNRTITADDTDAYADGIDIGVSEEGEDPAEGHLTIEGTVTSDDNVQVGVNAGDKGTLTVQGENASLALDDSNDMLRIGNGGEGRLEILDGATVDVQATTTFGRLEGGSGTGLVSGTGSALNTKYLYIGNGDTGTLTVEDGGAVTASNAYVGYNSSDSELSPAGTLDITGANSLFTATEDLNVGNANVTVDGGKLDVGDTIQIGILSDDSDDPVQAVFNITNGAAVTAKHVNVAWSEDRNGTLNIDGGSTLDVSGQFTVSNNGGNADVTIAGGSTVTTDQLLIEQDADSSDRNVSMLITGEGTSVTATALSGNQSELTNTLTVDDHAVLNTEDVAFNQNYMFDDGPGDSLVLSNEAVWNSNGTLTLNGGGMRILSGAQLIAQDLELTFVGVRRASFMVDGEGSLFKVNGTITPVLAGAESFQLSNGGTFDTASNELDLTGIWTIGGGYAELTEDQWGYRDPTGAGSFEAGEKLFFPRYSSGTLVFNHTEDEYVFSNDISGEVNEQGFVYDYGTITSMAGTTRLTGDLTQFAGDINVTGGKLVIDSDVYRISQEVLDDLVNEVTWGTAAYSVSNGGKLIINGTVGTEWVRSVDATVYHELTAGVYVGDNGFLGGSGTIYGDVTMDGDAMTISPGDDSVGTLTIQGDLYLNQSTVLSDASYYDVDIKGNGTSDLIDVTGSAEIAGSNAPTVVQVNALDSATSYQNGQTYTILKAGEGVEGEFSDVTSESAFINPTLTYTANSVILGINLIDTGNPDHTVEDGETYTSTDDVGALEVLSGGTLAIGGNGATGTLTSDDAVLFEDGSTYAVDIKGNGSSDKLTTTGAATLEGGTVEVTALDAQTSYQDGQTYSILEADGGVTGTFAEAVSKSAFLTTTLDYSDANAVQLKIGLIAEENDDVEVGDGGSYDGSGGGDIGGITIGGGGTLTPGGGGTADTIDADGDILFEDDSIFAVDIKGDGSSDKLTTTGKATLEGGTVEVTALDAQTSYQDGQTYSILEADGGVTGTFAEAVSKSAFLTTALDYSDAKAVQLKIGLITEENDDVEVGDGESYTGTGSVGGITVSDGGTLTPGGDGTTGTLASDGDVLFEDGSTYAVDIKGDGSSDKLTTTGKATLEGGTVEVTALDAQTSYQDGQTYSILEADGGVTGTFADAVSKSAFLTTTLDYSDTNAVQLKIGLISQGGGDDDSDDVEVGDGESYTGTGSVGGITVSDGGTLTPGSGGTTGTLTSDGPVKFEDGSTYAVDIKGDGSSDKLTTTGAATLEGGTVEVTALDAQASYQNGQTYSILEADGGVTGTFDEAVSKSAFLTTALDYSDSNKVSLSIQVQSDGGGDDDGDDDGDGDGDGGNNAPLIFQTVAETRNQYNIAMALNTLPQTGEALALYNTLLLQSAESARTAFESLSGEIYASTRGALLQDRFLTDTIGQRFDGQAAQTHADGTTVWVAGSGTQGNVSSDGNAAKIRTQRNGLAVGADWAIGNNLVLGVAAGTEDLDSKSNAVGSRAKTDSTQYGIYAAMQWNGLSLRGGATYADYEVKTSRNVQVGSLLAQNVASRHDANATRFFVEAGWDFALSDTFTLTPVVEIAYSRLESDGLVESGGNTALTVADSKDDYLTTTAGVRANWDISSEAIDHATLFAGLAWRNADGELKADSRQQFVAGGDAFTIYGAPLARNTGVADLGVALNTSANSRLSLAAHVESGNGARETGAQLNWNVKF